MDQVYFFTDLDELSSECEQHRSTNDIAITENLTIRLKNVVWALQNDSQSRYLAAGEPVQIDKDWSNITEIAWHFYTKINSLKND